MRRYRISIASALVGIMGLALAMAAVRSGTRIGSMSVEAAATIAKTAAIAGAVVARGRARAFSVGFALFGWQFLGWPFPPESQGARVTGARELARVGALALHPYAERSGPGTSTTGAPYEPTPPGLPGEFVSFDSGRRVYTYDAGHRAQNAEAAILGLANLAYAAFGGVLAVALNGRRREEDRPGQGHRP